MRLSFPHGEHADVQHARGVLRIGDAESNELPLPGLGLAPHHATLEVDPQRGVVLRVEGGAAVHVNARPVREMALLRRGDRVTLDRLTLLLKSDGDDELLALDGELAAPVKTERGRSSRTALRCVGGPGFGRSHPLRDGLDIGSGAEATLRIDDPALAPLHLRVGILREGPHTGRVGLATLAADAGGPEINGVVVTSALLTNGDQITLGRHRFVLEAPGLTLPRGSRPATTPPPRSRLSPAGDARDATDARSPGEASDNGRPHYGWLIAAASIIAAVLVFLLVGGPAD